MQLETPLRLSALAMQLSNALKTFVSRATNVPKRTANTMPTISARAPHTVPATACLVCGLVADLPEVLRPGQHARHRDREQEHQREPASPGLRGSGTCASTSSRLGTSSAISSALVKAVAGTCDTGIGGFLLPGRSGMGTLIAPAGRPLSRIRLAEE